MNYMCLHYAVLEMYMEDKWSYSVPLPTMWVRQYSLI